MDALILSGTAAGGLGLFLLAINMITDGLKLAGGEILRRNLKRWTATPLRGIGAGLVVTGIVQSSSAVTVAAIGFVNAGLLTLRQSIGVIYGANIGTTLTAWLVAAMGFGLQVESLALPLIGVGMLLRILWPGTGKSALGEAMAGFGLFFIGIGVLKGAFSGMAATIPLADLDLGGPVGLVLFVVLGFVMTLLTQSSSAAIAITLTAAAGGVLGLENAAATVIGANLGTTSTAALATIGARPNARRVAAAHILFNLLTGLVALLILPLMLKLVSAPVDVGGALPAPIALATTLALFHTAFNILGVLLLWPWTRRLATYLERHFRTEEEDESRPRHITRAARATAGLALGAIVSELTRVDHIARRGARAALGDGADALRRIESAKSIVDSLVLEIGNFTTRLRMEDLPMAIADALPKALRIGRYCDEVASLAVQIAPLRVSIGRLTDPQLPPLLGGLMERAGMMLEAADPERGGVDRVDIETRLAAFEDVYQDTKAGLLRAGAGQRIGIPELGHLLDQASHIRRLVEQATKAALYLDELVKAQREAGEEPKAEPETEPEPESEPEQAPDRGEA